VAQGGASCAYWGGALQGTPSDRVLNDFFSPNGQTTVPPYCSAFRYRTGTRSLSRGNKFFCLLFFEGTFTLFFKD
jgi:hypothetical protein